MAVAIGRWMFLTLRLAGRARGDLPTVTASCCPLSAFLRFPGGVGNTKNEGQDFESLYRDVTTKLFDRLPDETWVYPGHGGDTTLGAERPSLAEWRARGW